MFGWNKQKTPEDILRDSRISQMRASLGGAAPANRRKVILDRAYTHLLARGLLTTQHARAAKAYLQEKNLLVHAEGSVLGCCFAKVTLDRHFEKSTGVRVVIDQGDPPRNPKRHELKELYFDKS